MRQRAAAMYRLTEQPGGGDTARYRLEGTAGIATAKALLARGIAEFAGKPAVEIDLSGVEGADSAGLAVLLTWVARAQQARQRLSYAALPPQLRAIARVCSVEALLKAAESAPQG
jgi:phospholipid transport system transporter-binding protein